MVPHDARSELAAVAFGLSPAEYISKIWQVRIEASPSIKRPRSRSWPATCREKRGPFVIPQVVSNVTPIKRRKP